MERVVPASTFKQKCLALLDIVAESREPLIITKHGRAVARVVPLDEPGAEASLEGSVTFLVDDELLFSTGQRWDAEGSS